MASTQDSPRRTRLAVAEDDAGLREAVAATLRENGLDVVEATDGGALLGVLQRGGISLVVTDLMMPGLRGDDVLRLHRLRGDRTPFVVITAAPAPIVDSVQHVPEVTVLRKPFTEEALLAAVFTSLGLGPDGKPPTIAIAIATEPAPTAGDDPDDETRR